MSCRNCCQTVLLLAVFLGVAASVHAQGRLAPVPKPDGGRWRIGYYEGGAYNDYVPVTKATVQRWVELGWLEPAALACTETAADSAALWHCLAAVPSEFLEFVPDAYWSADWQKERRQANRAEFLRRAREHGDLDLVLALGTWAGQDLANNEHGVPTLVCSTSDAVAAGIIKSPGDSGFDHVHARVDPTRYARQVRLFHQVVGFKRLGMVYENSPEGISFAGLEQIAPLAEALGFELVTCEAPFSNVPLEQAQAAVLACHEELAPKVDALYITIHRGVDLTSIGSLLVPLFKHKVPTFAMGTLYEVNAGAMMGMAQPNFEYAGDFYAEVAARVFNGEHPRAINQILPDPQDLRINIETAKRIGFNIPIDIISDAEETVEVIEAFGAPPAQAAQ